MYLLSEAHVRYRERFFISNYHFFIWPIVSPGRKCGIVTAVKRGIHQKHADLISRTWIQVTGFCIKINNSESLLAAVCKSSGHIWADADIIELLSFRYKSHLADLSAKHPFWNSVVSKHPDTKVFNLLHINQFEISAPHYRTLYSPAGDGDMIDIVAHKNFR